MGWRPWEVRQCTLADLFSAFDGWKLANGIAEKDLSPDEVADIRAFAFGEGDGGGSHASAQVDMTPTEARLLRGLKG